MSLLLDALERADKSRRPGAGQELSLEARDGESTSSADGQALPPPAAVRALFDLQGKPSRRHRWLPWLLLALALVTVAVASLWLLSGLSAAPTALPVPPVLPMPRPPASAPQPGAATTSLPALTGITPPPPAGAVTANGVASAAHSTPPVTPMPLQVPTIARIGRDTLPGTPAMRLTSPAESGRTASGSGLGPAAPQGPTDQRRPAGERNGTAPTGSPATVAPADVRLFRSPARAQVDAGLQAAWTALRQGRSAEARDAYLAVEKRLPENPDVQLGLATLAVELGQAEEARARYQRVLVQDPLNQAAQAGLALLQPAGGAAGGLESQLRSRAAAQDGSARFALAARLSAAAQWPEAEQAWFDALQSDPDNPDALYNLAVALDHLQQGNAAAQHYRDALQAATRRTARFDRGAVEVRLRALGDRATP